MERTLTIGTPMISISWETWPSASSRCWLDFMWLKHLHHFSSSMELRTTSDFSLCHGCWSVQRNWYSTLSSGYPLGFTSSHHLKLLDTPCSPLSLVESLCVSFDVKKLTHLSDRFPPFLVFNLYCFLCVYSLFVLMREAEEYQRLIGAQHQVRQPNYGNTDTTHVKI